MLELRNNDLEKPTKEQEVRQVSDVADARDFIRAAYPEAAHGNAKGAIWAAARGLKLSSHRRARAIWNGEARRIDAHEMDALRQAALEGLKNERTRTDRRIEAMERRLAVLGEGSGVGLDS